MKQNKVLKFIRKIFQCKFGAHWNMVYDNGVPNDLVSPGTCLDCGYRYMGIKWPKAPRIHSMKCIECGKEIQGPGVLVSSDGDFVCDYLCKRKYEKNSDSFLNDIILDDEKYKKWLN